MKAIIGASEVSMIGSIIISTTQYRIRIALSALQLLRAESSYLQKSNNVAFFLFLLR